MISISLINHKSYIIQIIMRFINLFIILIIVKVQEKLLILKSKLLLVKNLQQTNNNNNKMFQYKNDREIINKFSLNPQSGNSFIREYQKAQFPFPVLQKKQKNNKNPYTTMYLNFAFNQNVNTPLQKLKKIKTIMSGNHQYRTQRKKSPDKYKINSITVDMLTKSITEDQKQKQMSSKQQTQLQMIRQYFQKTRKIAKRIRSGSLGNNNNKQVLKSINKNQFTNESSKQTKQTKQIKKSTILHKSLSRKSIGRKLMIKDYQNSKELYTKSRMFSKNLNLNQTGEDIKSQNKIFKYIKKQEDNISKYKKIPKRKVNNNVLKKENIIIQDDIIQLKPWQHIIEDI